MNDARKAAEQRVKRLRAFYAHLAIYIVINLFLLIVNLLATPDYLWFYWLSLAWGLGLIFDAYDTFFRQRFFGRDWEEKKIARYMKEHPDAKPEIEDTQDKKPGSDDGPA